MKERRKPQNWYDILQVSTDASQEEITKAFKARAKQYHPDVNKDVRANRQMQYINRAYEILGDPKKRAGHDKWLLAQQKKQPNVPPQQPPSNKQQPYSKPPKEQTGQKTRDAERESSSSELREPQFVLIPAGTFIMGSPYSEPGRGSGETQHQVTISKPFHMQTTPVTQGQWLKIMGYNYSYFKGDLNLPVEQVSWNYVQEFIKKLNKFENTDKYRLPTEAQWEYAARAGTTTAYYTGDKEEDLDKAGWYGKNSGNKTHPVGQKAPNAWGLYDMLGNIGEWVQDLFGDYPRGNVIDPEGPSPSKSVWHRINRGGSWYYNATQCRCANRRSNSPVYTNNKYVGFRLIKTL